MSVRHGLLALLAEGDRHGYQLRQEFEQRTGSFAVHIPYASSPLAILAILQNDVQFACVPPVELPSTTGLLIASACRPAGRW